ncbi:MAG: hypothetical protein CVV52_07130 [Spirochaetae bacterium HGW-Spirochaetae-8]|nr:MAG: hypothetical protein CVV52_07130 [Spirochaetae bacterium HGW-Spirochaetae-8]
MRKINQIVIVGAGPAGLSAGIHLRKGGWDVLIIEKSHFPKKKFCGGLLTRPAMDELASIGLEPSDTVLFHAIGSLIIHHGNTNTTIETADPFYVADREQLDTALFQIYKGLGGRTIEDTRVRKIIDDHTSLLSDGREIEFDYLIGADGATSRVRRYLNPHEKGRSGFCLGKASMTVIPTDPPDGLHINLNHLYRGYGWCFKVDGHCYSFGVGVENRGSKVRNAYENLCKTYEVPVQDSIGALLPFNHAAKIPARGHIFLAGDAMGLVDPFLGEGIYQALCSGRIAAETVSGHGSVREYARALGGLKAIYKAGSTLQTILKYAPIRNMFYSLALRHQGFLGFVCEETVLKKSYRYMQVPKLYVQYRRTRMN